MPEISWPVLLLTARITVVVALYLFVLVAASALRAEIRARTSLAPIPQSVANDEFEADEAPLQRDIPGEVIPPRIDYPEPISDRHEVRPRPRRSLQALLAPLAVGIPLLVVGAMVLVLRPAPVPAESTPRTQSPSTTQSTPVAIPGRIAISLLAAEDTSVRVTIDGTVQFDGMMRAGERRSWDGKSLAAVWTDKGKTLGLAIDGRDLGPYSPAMGHPDWNRIEYSFWPGWSQSQPR